MQKSDLLVQNLGQDVDTNFFLTRLAKLDISLAELLVFSFVQHDLRQNLVGKGTRHDERGMAGCAAQINKTSFSEENNVAAVLHQETINLRFDVLYALRVFLQPCNVNLNVEMSDV